MRRGIITVSDSFSALSMTENFARLCWQKDSVATFFNDNTVHFESKQPVRVVWSAKLLMNRKHVPFLVQLKANFRQNVTMKQDE